MIFSFNKFIRWQNLGQSNTEKLFSTKIVKTNHVRSERARPRGLPCVLRGSSSAALPNPTGCHLVAHRLSHASVGRHGTREHLHDGATDLSASPAPHHACSVATLSICQNTNNISICMFRTTTLHTLWNSLTIHWRFAALLAENK